jgi:hypothetical protein
VYSHVVLFLHDVVPMQLFLFDMAVLLTRVYCMITLSNFVDSMQQITLGLTSGILNHPGDLILGSQVCERHTELAGL